MNLANSDNSTLYDVLDLKPDASQQEVREAYIRTKSAYDKGSLALYTLISAQEREEILRRVEEAYETLSHAEKRKEYDRCHGLLSPDQEMIDEMPVRPSKKIISIDRVPPMEATPGEDLLVAPSTDFGEELEGMGLSDPTSAHARGPSNAPIEEESPASVPQDRSETRPVPTPAQQAPQGAALSPGASQRAAAEDAITQEIALEKEWQGSVLRRIREARRISVEELSHITKVSKTYLTAIENEDFKKLPASVFVRGFIVQICRILKIPADPVVSVYMARYNLSRAPVK